MPKQFPVGNNLDPRTAQVWISDDTTGLDVVRDADEQFRFLSGRGGVSFDLAILRGGYLFMNIEHSERVLPKIEPLTLDHRLTLMISFIGLAPDDSKEEE